MLHTSTAFIARASRPKLAVAALALAFATIACGKPAAPTVAVLAAPGMGFAEKWVDVKGVKTRYLEAGQGEALVLVHGAQFGAGASAATWDRNIAGLARTFHVYAFDKLGQGMTDNPVRDEGYSIEGVLQHGYDFVKAVGLTRFHLVGQSRGGYFVARFTLEHPEMVRTLVICDTNTLAPERPDGESHREELLYKDEPKNDRRAAQIYRWKQLSYTTDHITDEDVDLAVKIQTLPKSKAAIAKNKELNNQFERTLAKQKVDTLARIKAGELKNVATLLSWGFNDRSAVIENGRALFDIVAAGNPRARMYIFNHAGHFHFREYPDEWNKMITTFIDTFKPTT